ncbi:hypothetical protein L0C25_19720 [Solicola gregarius]|uniref:Uncharacterized protein n=1 Tax=Solicola gregarius TaxID=2908642 RepID=A0AA46YJM4_9ACTN|nr:hypothetical protein [Solicola gregarius]UYM04740.1 hypothetical protein L0C25_19720 [Solicola gregarius]
MHQQRARPSRGGRDKHPLAGCDPPLAYETQRGDAVVDRRGRLLRADSVGYLDYVLDVGQRLLRVRARRTQGNLAPDPHRVHPWPDRRHLAGAAATRYVRGLEREVLPAPAAAQQGVQVDDVGRGKAYDDLSRAGHGIRHLLRYQRLWSAELVHPDRLHAASSWSRGLPRT